MKRRLTSLALGTVLAGTLAFGSVGAQDTAVERLVVNQNGASGLVAAVIDVNDVIADNETIDIAIIELNDSLNNVRALNNVLNNSPILSNNDIDIEVGDVTVLQDFLNNNNVDIDDFLSDNNIVLNDIIAVGVLSTGDLIVFV